VILRGNLLIHAHVLRLTSQLNLVLSRCIRSIDFIYQLLILSH
jgi:hypothetical protein